nr:TerB family tellurite resistance protein [Rhodoferax sp.]
MTPTDQKSLLTIALFAAFSDGVKAEAEREEIRRIAASLGSAAQGVDIAALYQDVLLKRTSVAAAAQALQDADYRQLAYEMAVCVCDADGQQTVPEQQFLAALKQQLRLGDAQTQVFDAQAQAQATALTAALPIAVIAPAATPLNPPSQAPTVSPGSSTDAALDKSILNYAILNGALELLPQSWASMAIIPLQVKMVYAIGKTHGV